MQSGEESYLNELSRIIRGGVILKEDRRVSFGGNIKIDMQDDRHEWLTQYMECTSDLSEEFDWLLNGGKSINAIIASGGTHMNDLLIEESELGGDGKLIDRPLILVDMNKEIQSKVTIPSLDLYDLLKLSHKEIVAIYKSYLDTLVDSTASPWLISLWSQLIKQSFNQVIPEVIGEVHALTKSHVFGIVEEWFDFDQFISDITQCGNYTYAENMYTKLDEHMTHIEYDSYDDCAITGTWDRSPIIGPDTAMFLPMREINDYIDQETRGVVKLNLNADRVLQTNPVLVLHSTIDAEYRVNPNYSIDSIENVAVEYLEGKRLRYAKSFGKIK